MGIKNKTLTGKNLCWMNCTDRNSTIHPQTGDDQVLMTGYSNEQSLKKWIYSNPDSPDTDFVNTTSLKEWLLTNYPISGTATLPIASSTNLGCVKIIDTTYLTINNEGGLGVNVGNINNYIGQHINISLATFGTSGTIHLGNDLPLPSDFNNTAIRNSLNDKQLPLQLDSNGHAGTNVPKYNYSGQQEGFIYVESPLDATGKFLSANGTWENIPSATTYDTLSSTDYDSTKSYVVKGPGILDNTKYLSSNGTWTTPASMSVFIGTDGNTGGTQGLVPAPSVSDVSKFLSSDGTWATTPSSTVFTGATASANGTRGLVPAPYVGDRGKFLSGSGTWKGLPYMTIVREFQSGDIELMRDTNAIVSYFGDILEEDFGKVFESATKNDSITQNVTWKFTGDMSPLTGESNLWLQNILIVADDIFRQFSIDRGFHYDIYFTIEFTVGSSYSQVEISNFKVNNCKNYEVLEGVHAVETLVSLNLDIPQLESNKLYQLKYHLTCNDVSLNPNVRVWYPGVQVSLKTENINYHKTSHVV